MHPSKFSEGLNGYRSRSPVRMTESLHTYRFTLASKLSCSPCYGITHRAVVTMLSVGTFPTDVTHRVSGTSDSSGHRVTTPA